VPEEAVEPELGDPDVEPALAPVPAALPDATLPLVVEPDDPDDGPTEPDMLAVAPEVGVTEPVALVLPELGVPFTPLAAEPEAVPDVGSPFAEPMPDEFDPEGALCGEVLEPQPVADPPTTRRTHRVDRRFMVAN
jgi:hypothetical protein